MKVANIFRTVRQSELSRLQRDSEMTVERRNSAGFQPKVACAMIHEKATPAGLPRAVSYRGPGLQMEAREGSNAQGECHARVNPSGYRLRGQGLNAVSGVRGNGKSAD